MKPFNVLLLSVLAMFSIGCAAHQPRQKAATVVVTKVEVRKALPVEVRRAIPVVREVRKVQKIASDQPAFAQEAPPAVVTRPEAKPVTAPSVAKKPSLAETGLDRFHRLAVLPPIQMPERVDGGVTVFWVTIGIAIILAVIAVKVVERDDQADRQESEDIINGDEALPLTSAEISRPLTEKPKRKRAARPRKPKAAPEEALS